jgi:hypothetical protein
VIIKIYHRLVLIFGLCFLVGNAEANTTPLRECVAGACSEIVHHKELGKATVTVWDDKGHIISADTFDLDSSAELVHVSTSDSVSIKDNVGSVSSLTDSAPVAPCSTGSCSVPVSRTHQTATHIVVVTITFTYFNGVLVGVQSHQEMYDLPSQMEN